MTALSPEIARLLAPQEEVDQLRAEALRHAGPRFVDLAYANSYDGPTPDAISALRQALVAPGALALQYTPYGGATVARRLVAEALRRTHGLPFHLKDVVLTPGAMSALNILFRAVRQDVGDEVIVITPCWLDYPVYLENLGLRTRFVPVDSVTLRLDLAAIRAAISPRTRAVILSQPANPSGLIYSDDELNGLADVLRSSGVSPLLISDECHRDLVFGGHSFVSPSRYYDATCVVYSMGKVLALQGQRFGYIGVSPQHPNRGELSELLVQLTRVMGFCTPTSLMQLAVGDLLKIKAPVELIAARRERTLSALNQMGCEVSPSQATFFLYPRVPGGDDVGFVRQLAKKGVMVLPSSVFHHSGHFRISLTSSDEALEQGLGLIAGVFAEYNGA